MSTCCGKSAAGEPCNCAEGEAHAKDAAMQQAVDEPTRPQPPLMTMDEARVAVARMMNNVLTQSAQQVREAMALDPDTASNQYKNGDMMVRAAAEFIAANALVIKKLTRPRILRPERSIKVTRQ